MIAPHIVFSSIKCKESLRFMYLGLYLGNIFLDFIFLVINSLSFLTMRCVYQDDPLNLGSMRNIIGKFLCGSDLFVCATFICVIVEILQFFVCVFMLVFQRKIGVIFCVFYMYLCFRRRWG